MIIAALLLVVSTKQPIVGAILFLIGMVIAARVWLFPVAQLFSPILTLWFAREGDLARSNMIRQPGGVAITASTLMIGLATLIMIASLVTSMGQLITKLVADTFKQRYLDLTATIGIYTRSSALMKSGQARAGAA